MDLTRAVLTCRVDANRRKSKPNARSHSYCWIPSSASTNSDTGSARTSSILNLTSDRANDHGPKTLFIRLGISATISTNWTGVKKAADQYVTFWPSSRTCPDISNGCVNGRLLFEVAPAEPAERSDRRRLVRGDGKRAAVSGRSADLWHRADPIPGKPSAIINRDSTGRTDTCTGIPPVP
jgi:hypothetical protein